MISNDAGRIEIAPYFVAFLVVGPALGVASLIMLAKIVDTTFLFGFVLIALIVLIQVALAKVFDYYRSVTTALKVYLNPGRFKTSSCISQTFGVGEV